MNSTAASEAIASAFGIFNMALPNTQLLEAAFNIPIECVLRVDNQAHITSIENGFTTALRYLPKTHRLSIASLGDLHREGVIRIKKIHTEENAANIFTKDPSDIATFKTEREMLGIIAIDECRLLD